MWQAKEEADRANSAKSDSADYFTKVFKEITGVSPAQYKQSL